MKKNIKTYCPSLALPSNHAKSLSKFVMLITVFCFLPNLVNTTNAATYYLDAVNGDDSNPGTSNLPWQTLAKAQSSIVDGDTVLIRDGEYGDFIQKNSGHDDWVTYQADTGHTPIFTSITATNSIKDDLYLRFNGINIEYPIHEGNSPSDPPWEWEDTYSILYFSKVDNIEILNCVVEAESKYLLDYSLFAYDVDNLKIDHCELKSTLAGPLTLDCTNLTISYNHIHNLAKGSGMSIRPGSKEPDDLIGNLIESNNIHNISNYNNQDDYFPPEILFVALGDDPWDDIEDPPDFNANDVITQGKVAGQYKGVRWYASGNRWEVYVIMTTDAMRFETSEECTASISGITFTPTAHYEQFHVGTGLAIHVPNTTIKKNIIHDFDGQGIYFYAGNVFYNMVVENNLIYDTGSYTALAHFTGSALIRNNTFVGSINNDGLEAWNDILNRYGGQPFVIGLEDGFNGTGVEIYNNIIVGMWDLPDSDNYIEDYNIWWERGTNAGENDLEGAHSIVAVWKDESFNPHGYPEFFEELDGLAVWTQEHPQGSEHTPFFVNPGYYTCPDKGLDDDKGLEWDYRLATGSPGINFGDPANQPTDSLGSVGADGFINNNGLTRDSSHHSVGCYEYVASDPDNSAPVLAPIGNKSVNENLPLEFTISATDADIDDTITYSATNLPNGATLNTSTGAFAWMPSYMQAGSYSVSFRASDGQDTDSETIAITVNNVNRPPVLAPIGSKSIDEAGTLSFTISATDVDGDSITYSAMNLPSGAALNSSTGAFAWTPDYTQSDSYNVTFTASDGSEQDSEIVTITVNNTNRAPVLSAIGNKTIYPNNLLSFTISATDPDGDTITYSATNLPTGATLDSAGGEFSWTPGASQAGTHSVTFAASDGQLEDSEIITITVYGTDAIAPQVTGCSPDSDSIQVALNHLVILHVTDGGVGVDAATVSIEINDSIVYTGNTTDYSSTSGHCRRIGTSADYTYVYQADETFGFDQTITVTVNATDLAGNSMSEYEYSFNTEMRSFGENKLASSTTGNNDSTVTVCDSNGNIWVAWHTGNIGSRDIYIGRLTTGAESFDASLRLTNNSSDQLNPTMAIDGNDKLYLAWQDNRNGEWDIYVSTSSDGVTFSSERKVTDPNSNQINPVIAVDNSSPATAYLAWEDDRYTDKDIYVAASTNSFLTKTTWGVTLNGSDQTEPAIAIDSTNTAYVVWTDERNGSKDIYGADSDSGPWTNVPVTTGAGDQSGAVIAMEEIGTILHFAWVKDSNGDSDIYYASSTGLPSSALAGSNIVNDTSGANQTMPTIITTASTGNNLKVFVCWKDQRDNDTDLYFVEAAATETNILIGDDATNSNQSRPAICVDSNGYPYIVWTDSRDGNTAIYYAASTFANSNTLASVSVSAVSEATVGTDPASITSTDDVSVVIPAGACLCDTTITISEVKNPQQFSLERSSFIYEFGPSGIVFSSPVIITIPYDVSSAADSISAYWFNPLTGTLSQQGITNIEIIEISPTLNALRFSTTHFTQFFVGGNIDGVAGGGSGGGGCSMAPNHQESMVEFLLPYAVAVLAIAILKLRDVQKRKQHKITGTD